MYNEISLIFFPFLASTGFTAFANLLHIIHDIHIQSQLYLCRQITSTEMSNQNQ